MPAVDGENPPGAYSSKVSGVCPAMSSISSHQTGTNAASSSQASRLRAWLRSENRHATGNCRNAGALGGAAGAAGPGQGQWRA